MPVPGTVQFCIVPVLPEPVALNVWVIRLLTVIVVSMEDEHPPFVTVRPTVYVPVELHVTVGLWDVLVAGVPPGNVQL